MTKREKAIVRNAISQLLEENGNFAIGIDNLCKLVGWEYPSARIKIKSATIADLIHKNSTFFDPGKKE